MTHATAEYLKANFGELAKVEYHEVADENTKARFPEILALIEKNRWPLPVVAIDGEIVTVGYIAYWVIADQIQERLKDAS